jgi:hypothetical protein
MTPRTDRTAILPGRRRTAWVIAVALVLSGFGLTGCGVVKAVNKVKNDVEGNKAVIDQFTTNLKSGEAKPFEATYTTTGSSPTKIVYAVQPPQGLVFKDTMSGSGSNDVSNVDIIVNSSGEYSCTPPTASGSGSGSRWTCQKLGKAGAAAKNQILNFYTPSHWVVFLRDFSLAAGFAGDKVTTSNITVHGFSMHCVDFRAGGVQGTSKICTTAQGILGYVKVASDSTSFEIRSYTASPPASLFRLPRGARVTKPPRGTR